MAGGSLCAPPLHRRSVSCAAILKAKAWRSSCLRALGSVAHCQASATAIAFERSSGAGGGNGSQSHCSRPWGLRWLGPCRCCYHWRSPLHACTGGSMRWSSDFTDRGFRGKPSGHPAVTRFDLNAVSFPASLGSMLYFSIARSIAVSSLGATT